MATDASAKTVLVQVVENGRGRKIQFNLERFRDTAKSDLECLLYGISEQITSLTVDRLKHSSVIEIESEDFLGEFILLSPNSEINNKSKLVCTVLESTNINQRAEDVTRISNVDPCTSSKPSVTVVEHSLSIFYFTLWLMKYIVYLQF